MANFQRELEASRRTIARDLDFLRLEENPWITYDPKDLGYRLVDQSFALPPVEISQGDLANLAASRADLGDTSSSPAARAMDWLLGKIAETGRSNCGCARCRESNSSAGYSHGGQTCARSPPASFRTRIRRRPQSGVPEPRPGH